MAMTCMTNGCTILEVLLDERRVGLGIFWVYEMSMGDMGVGAADAEKGMLAGKDWNSPLSL